MDCSPIRLLCPWDSPEKNAGVGCLALLHSLIIGWVYSQQDASVGVVYLVDDYRGREVENRWSRLNGCVNLMTLSLWSLQTKEVGSDMSEGLSRTMTWGRKWASLFTVNLQ